MTFWYLVNLITIKKVDNSGTTMRVLVLKLAKDSANKSLDC